MKTSQCAVHTSTAIYYHIDQCFRSLLDLLHEGSLIEEKVNIIQSLELNTFNRYAHGNNKGLPQT